jgi:hypothetical protein
MSLGHAQGCLTGMVTELPEGDVMLEMTGAVRQEIEAASGDMKKMYKRGGGLLLY